MRSLRRRRLGISMALAVGMSPLLLSLSPAQPAKPKNEHFTGKVVPLKDVVAKSGITLDKDAASQSLAVLADDGKTYSLVKDAGSRMFFNDERLVNRRMRLTGYLVDKTPFLKVVQVHSYVNGELNEVYYWCDICSIKRFYKAQCECCQGPMELRETPVKK